MSTLETRIVEYQKKGWILLSSTSQSAQLRKPRVRWSCLPNLLFTLLAVVGIVLVTNGQDAGYLLVVLGVIVPVLYALFFLLRLLFGGRERIITLFTDEPERKAT